MDTLSKIVKKADFLGRKHSPTFKSTSSVKTCLGGLLSIVFCVTVSIGIFFLGRELYERTTPLSNLSESREEQNEIRLADIQPIFTIFDANGNVLVKNEDFLKSIKISLFLSYLEKSKEGNLNLRKINIPVIGCSESVLSNVHYELLKSSEIAFEAYMCMDTANLVYSNGEKVTEPLAIRNTSSSVGGVSLRLDILASDSETTTEQQGFTLHMVTMSSFLDITSYDSPIKYALEEAHQRVMPEEERQLSIRFKINELKTDTGYIFSTEETEQYFSLDSTSKEANKYSETDKRLFRLVFDVSMIRNVMNRKYLKLQQLIASTGGFIKAMTIILGFVLRVHSEVTLFNSINREKFRIEGKTYLISKNEPFANNFTHEKTISPVLKKSNRVGSPVGFCRYLRALLPLSKDFALKSEIQETFAYFDILTTIKLVSKVEMIEENFKELLIKLNKFV